VYKLDALIDRSGGAQQPPRLWRGEPAPEALEVMEAGVRYHVELGEQLSTGLFLDQRPQRTWLSGRTPQHTPSLTPPLTSGMRLLNTFAHAGGFSVAAACAGAETVSVDLSRKWLERVPLHLALNGLSEQGHQLLTGDVFEWVRRLAKRGERFEMIILDPPSTSVGKAKKRWSAKRDYPELVQLALPLLAPGGRLMTSTNHRQLTPARFAQLVASALPKGFVLERVCAPGVDFPTDGPMSVKNLIWRAPL
jgi:23S rRNA (cytosine1962-C5)-methyltransferase